MEICGKCMGTGVAGHPDSGYTCDCNGGMTDPTSTRAEVEIARFDPCPFGGAMTLAHDGDYVRYDDHQALRERAEAAENERAEQWRQRREAEAARDTALAISDAARRAEAAAWNDAIEIERELIAAYVGAVPQVVTDRQENMSAIERGTYLQHPYMVEHYSDRIRALRHAAPTEVEA